MRFHFTDPDVWTGGFYELCLELPAQDDATTAYGLAALWRSPQLSGCFVRNDIEPTQQVARTLESLPVEGHLYGVATLGDGQHCVCGSYTTHFADEGRWLGFYLPMGAFAQIYPVGSYPFGRATLQLEHTLKVVNEWFRTLAEEVYKHLAFTFGVIGFETDFSAIKAQALQAIPTVRWEGLVIPTDDHLLWYPPTEYGAQFT
jgi:hypothetical protein